VSSKSARKWFIEEPKVPARRESKRQSGHGRSVKRYAFARRHVAGAVPIAFLKARENAASDS